MRFALLTLFSNLSCASAEVVECSYDGGCQGPGCKWTRLYEGRCPEGSRRERYIDVTEGPSCGRKGDCVSVCKIVGCNGPAGKCKIALKRTTTYNGGCPYNTIRISPKAGTGSLRYCVMKECRFGENHGTCYILDKISVMGECPKYTTEFSRDEHCDFIQFRDEHSAAICN